MSQRKNIILTPFPSCSFEYVGAQGSGTVVLPIMLVPVLPRNNEHMEDGEGKGLLDALLTLFLLFTLLLFLVIFIYAVPRSLLLPGHIVLSPLALFTKI